MLRQRKRESLVDHKAERLGALIERDDQGRHAFRRVAPADAGEIFVDKAFLAGAEPSDVEGERRQLSE